MKKHAALFSLMAALFLPTQAMAKSVTFTTELTKYDGQAAYLAMYLTNAEGAYQQTLWISGESPKPYKYLRGWAKASGLKKSEYDGRTGATVKSGDSYTVTLDLDDSLINAGYQVHIDAAVEDQRPSRDDIKVTLTSDGSGKANAGTTYVKSFTYKL